TDLTQIHGIGPFLALRLIAECGTDLSRWPTAKHFTSWLTLSPGCKISGGKILSAHTRKTSNRVTVALRLAAVAIGRSNTRLEPSIVVLPPDWSRQSRHGNRTKDCGAVLQRDAIWHGLSRSWCRLL
ncbi:transposase, partial [Chromobacterium sphagni]|uniref:transposase n=1 Tax=Chromobacterium sphagni TaxID=1903179 RepID=UPI0019D36094